MARLSVKNVGPIREADIEVKKYTVFIGPQGTGKSTLAKLIAIGGDIKIVQGYGVNQGVFDNYTLQEYINSTSEIDFSDENHSVVFKDYELNLSYREDSDQPILSNKTFQDFLELLTNDESEKKLLSRIFNDKKEFEDMMVNFILEKKNTIYYYYLCAVRKEFIGSLERSSMEFNSL